MCLQNTLAHYWNYFSNYQAAAYRSTNDYKYYVYDLGKHFQSTDQSQCY